MAGDEPTLAADKLKKVIKKARSVPFPFGFNPGTSDADDEYLVAKQRKPPEMMGKLALAEGAGTRSAFGTFMVVGSEVHLTCFRTVSQLAKKFKRYLKLNKITLNVTVMDPDGNVLDSDVETLTEWFDEADDGDGDEDDAPPPAAPPPPGAAAAQAPEAPQRPDAQAAMAALLTDRLKALQPRILEAPGPVAAKLATLFKAAVGQVRGGKLPEAIASIKTLEATFARIQKTPGAPAATPAPAPAQRGPDPRVPRLREAVGKLMDRAQALLGDGAEVILDDLSRAGAQIDLGEIEAAMGSLREAQERIAAAVAAKAKWDRVSGELAPMVEAALKRGGDDAGTIRTRWGFATGLAEVGDWPRAVAALPGIINLLKTGLAAGAAAAPAAAVPQGTVAFQKARVLWVGARAQMLAEAEKLAAAITAASADDADAADIAAAASGIVAEVRRVDDRLLDVLDRLTNADPAARDPLKREAAGVIAAYRGLLAGGVFPAIDDNPFAPVAVAASARMALDQIARALA